MTVASHFGEYDVLKMTSLLTHRQFLTWEAWLRNEWNRPNRTDHYLMQLTAVVSNLVSQQQSDLSKYKIKWKFEHQSNNDTECQDVNNPDYRSPAERRTMDALGVTW